MKIKKFSTKPKKLDERIGAKPIICYPNNDLNNESLNILHEARKHLNKMENV